MVWLITGGAGYIGSHTAWELSVRGLELVVLDDLSAGHPDKLPPNVPVVRGSIHDQRLLAKVFRSHRITGVLHLAGLKSARDSTIRPLTYFQENVGGMLSIIEACRAAAVGRFILGSSAAIYGSSSSETISEADSPTPTTAYGQSKLVCEQLLSSFGAEHDISWIIFRYFNVVGAARPNLCDCSRGGLIPELFRAASTGTRFRYEGIDRPTRDGTAVRDFVNVRDIGRLHVDAMLLMESRARCSRIYNVGTGKAWSVREVVTIASSTVGWPLSTIDVPPRPGDPDAVVARTDNLSSDFDWHPSESLDMALREAWNAWLTIDKDGNYYSRD
jgi:UDP-glucose 4-epimerase